MASTPLVDWQTVRLDRIDQLYEAHTLIEGTEVNSRGRRWRTGQINRLIVIALLAEFQGYARELHDATADEFVSRAGFLGPKVVGILRTLMTQDRRLDKANPDVNSLSADYARFGLDLWPKLVRYNALTPNRQKHLTRIVKARNGIAHADDSKIAQLEADGFPITLKTVKRWRSALSGLVDTMDKVMSDHIVAVHGGLKPW